MAALKKKPGMASKRPGGFDRSKLNTGFMANAKKAKDESQGWALDFENDKQNVVVP